MKILKNSREAILYLSKNIFKKRKTAANKEIWMVVQQKMTKIIIISHHWGLPEWEWSSKTISHSNNIRQKIKVRTRYNCQLGNKKLKLINSLRQRCQAMIREMSDHLSYIKCCKNRRWRKNWSNHSNKQRSTKNRTLRFLIPLHTWWIFNNNLLQIKLCQSSFKMYSKVAINLKRP